LKSRFKFLSRNLLLIHLLNGDVIINYLNEELNEFLEGAGKKVELNTIDTKIYDLNTELKNQENKKTTYKNSIVSSKIKINDLKRKKGSIKLLNYIKKEESKLTGLENDYELVEKQIQKTIGNINDLEFKKDELTKKCLMKLHSDIKKHHQKVNEAHDIYVELYTKAREERHVLERKMMNLKSIVYKNYKVRLI